MSHAHQGEDKEGSQRNRQTPTDSENDDCLSEVEMSTCHHSQAIRISWCAFPRSSHLGLVLVNADHTTAPDQGSLWWCRTLCFRSAIDWLTQLFFLPATGLGMDSGLLQSGASMMVIVISSFGVHECSYGNVISLDILNHAIGSHKPNELLINGCEIRASAELHLEAETHLLSALFWKSPSDRAPWKEPGLCFSPC